MIVFALDLATKCGFAVGEPGALPRSGTVILKQRGEHRRVALSNLIVWLGEEWTKALPSIVVTEAPFSLQAFADRGNSEDAVRITFGLHGIVEAMTSRFGLQHEEVYAATVRKHLLGGVKRGSTREATKRAVVSRVQLLGYMPRTCMDDNRADALAVWDWACAHLAKSPPRELVMFGEEQRA